MSAALFQRAMDGRDYRGPGPRGPPPPMRDLPPRDYGPGPGPRAMYGPPDSRMDVDEPALPPPQPAFVIDREKTCPLLMRVFARPGGHHKLEEFAVRGKEPKDEIAIYTWMDASLRELSDLIKEVNILARNRNARMSFAFIYPDRRGRNVMRQVGVVHSTRPSEDDHKTLKQLNFQTGDYVSVAINT